MRRREFITLLSGVAVGRPLGADAQQGDRMRRLGILMAGAESDPQYQADVAVFREGLQKLGWVDGQNIRIEVRWAGFNAETMRRYAKELIALRVSQALSRQRGHLEIMPHANIPITIHTSGRRPVSATHRHRHLKLLGSYRRGGLSPKPECDEGRYCKSVKRKCTRAQDGRGFPICSAAVSRSS
jgi:hypothetical protein